MFSSASRPAATAAALLLLAAPARADDQSAGVTPGPFRAEPAGDVVATSAKVMLDGEQVRVALAVTVRPNAAIRLDLPRFGWLGEGDAYPDRQFPELKVGVDGRAITPADDFTATAKGKDVTAAVRAAGVDPFAVAETPPLVAATPGRTAAFDALVAAGAVTKAPEGFLAGWSAARIVRVTPGAGAHLVSFRYTARPAFALGPLVAAGVRWADYCTTAAAVVRVLAQHGLSGAVVVRRYTIPAALGGVRPRDLTLSVTAQPGAATIVCGPAGKALTDPAGEVAVREGADGAVRVLRLMRPR